VFRNALRRNRQQLAELRLRRVASRAGHAEPWHRLPTPRPIRYDPEMLSFRSARVVPMVVGAMMLVAAPAAAQSSAADSEARALFERAQGHYRAGEHRSALALYLEAYELRQLPGFLFNIAQCYRLLGDSERAVHYLRSYLTAAPDAANRDVARELLEMAQRDIERKKPPKDASPSPEPHARTARPPSPAATTTTTTPRAIAKGPQREPAMRQTPPRPRERALVETTPAATSARADRRGPWLWTGIGVSAALLAAGTVTGVMAAQRSSEYNAAETSIDRRLVLRDSGQKLATASVITLALGAATALATGFYYLWSDDAPASASVTAGIAPTGTGATATIVGSF